MCAITHTRPDSLCKRMREVAAGVRGNLVLAADCDSLEKEAQDRNHNNALAPAGQTADRYRQIRSVEPRWIPAAPHELARRWPRSRENRVRAAMPVVVRKSGNGAAK